MRLLIFLFVIHWYCVNEIRNVRMKRSKTSDPHAFSSCFEDIGCISTTEKWYHEKHRPKNLEPLDRHTIRTEFLLMKNCQNASSAELLYDSMSLKKESIEVAGFKKAACTIFIIHDFTSNGYTGWIKHIVVAFGKKTDCNLVSIDWEAGAEPPFEQAIANARVVALEAQHFLNLIKVAFGQSLDNVHMIGHGVGAHIAGYIGKSVKGIQRITGLDPTGPSFEMMPPEVRLDIGDAKYVEVLHTDAFNHRSQGGKKNYGHVSFLINNAEHQPGCNDSSHYPSFLTLHRDTLQEGRILPACSHKRSFKYYIQAIEDDQCHFIGVKCSTYHDFLLGKCNDCTSNHNNCAAFGLHPPSTSSRNNTYYLLTNNKKPFCLVTYAVNITITKGPKKEVEGYFEMILIDDENKVANATNNIHGDVVRKLDAGLTYHFLFYASPPQLTHVKEAKVKWVYKSKKICILCEKSVYLHELSIRRLTFGVQKPMPLSWLCPIKSGVEMKTGDFIEFINCETLYGANYTVDHIQRPISTNPTVALAPADNNNKAPAFASASASASSSGDTSPGLAEMCASLRNDQSSPMPLQNQNSSFQSAAVGAVPRSENAIPPASHSRSAEFSSANQRNEMTTEYSVAPGTKMEEAVKTSVRSFPEFISSPVKKDTDFKECVYDDTSSSSTTEDLGCSDGADKRRNSWDFDD